MLCQALPVLQPCLETCSELRHPANAICSETLWESSPCAGHVTSCRFYSSAFHPFTWVHLHRTRGAPHSSIERHPGAYPPQTRAPLCAPPSDRHPGLLGAVHRPPSGPSLPPHRRCRMHTPPARCLSVAHNTHRTFTLCHVSCAQQLLLSHTRAATIQTWKHISDPPSTQRTDVHRPLHSHTRHAAPLQLRRRRSPSRTAGHAVTSGPVRIRGRPWPAG